MANKPFVQSLLASIINLVRRWIFYILAWVRQSTGPVITLDTGRRVRIGHQIAEGGFSIVFYATDASRNDRAAYALKRIACPDPELLQACRNEAGVHRSMKHRNLMPLLGMAIEKNDSLCYMLFPYYPLSLRQEVNRRTFERELSKAEEPPWSSELTVLHIFHRIVQGVLAFHEQGQLSHRDIKLENILFGNDRMQPVLMDFGSAGPLVQSLENRREVLMIAEQASIHTTMSYRSPELFEGGVRTGDNSLDYAKVDVWSLGCVLFAMLYGASPTESEFYQRHSLTSDRYVLKVTECTQLSVLKQVPTPPVGSPASKWYSDDIHSLIAFMLEQDRQKRPSIASVMKRVEDLIEKQGGRVVDVANNSNLDDDFERFEDVDIQGDGIALMTSNRMGV